MPRKSQKQSLPKADEAVLEQGGEGAVPPSTPAPQDQPVTKPVQLEFDFFKQRDGIGVIRN